VAIRVGINGFGRIGRLAFRILASRPEEFEVSLVNDVAEPGTLVNLLKYDTTYGPFPGELAAQGSELTVNGRRVRLLRERDPARLPWTDAGVDAVLEASGVFRTRESLEKHLAAGASKVLLSAPGKGDRPVDATVVLGVNEGVLEPQMRLVSNGSCTTNCVAPMAKVLHDRFGIADGLMTTMHAYTSSQALVDGINKDPRRARAAAQNIIPTTTGAADMVGKVIPELEGKLTGLALRVPVLCGSITDLTVTLRQSVTKEAVNEAFREAAQDSMRGVLQYTEEPLVSSDIIRNPHSCILDGSWTQIRSGRLAKVLGWYDNEWAYSCRCADVLKRLAELR
jgi:glyceraldehyde 3-phosphate dehydrogenase